jgi:hypothetical protein
MTWSSAILAGLAGSYAAAAQASPAASNGSINWFHCAQNQTIPVTCGTLTVPLDYTDPSSNRTVDLQLLKVNATKQPSKGSILFNPGGPGDGGRTALAGLGAELLM